jgi:hypothetical protein
MRLQIKSKAPVSVAGILAVPLFFVALMAFTLKIDTPTRTLRERIYASKQLRYVGKVVIYGDPTKGTVGTIYALSFAVAIAVVLVGALASTLRSRLATTISSAAAIVATLLLWIPLGTWAVGHTARYPFGTDNISDKNLAQNLMNQGEWERSAIVTAHEIGWVTIALAVAAIVLTLVFELRGRRGVVTSVPLEGIHAPDATTPGLSVSKPFG